MKTMYNNAATIRSMDDDDLAEFLERWKINSVLCAYGKLEGSQMIGQKEIKRWLQSTEFECMETKKVSI